MTRVLVLFFALLLPVQFAWSAASAYCEHESSESQSHHFGHHAHVHHGEVKKASATKLAADPDCASCHAASASAITAPLYSRSFAASSAFAPRTVLPPFSSAPARAPDRPQWLRLV